MKKRASSLVGNFILSLLLLAGVFYFPGLNNLLSGEIITGFDVFCSCPSDAYCGQLVCGGEWEMPFPCYGSCPAGQECISDTSGAYFCQDNLFICADTGSCPPSDEVCIGGTNPYTGDLITNECGDVCPGTKNDCGSCTSNCVGKVCGDNGCGGSCGTCPSGSSCSNGVCVSSASNCGNCDDNNPCTFDTCFNGQCVHDNNEELPGCSSINCIPSCTGKSCGNDECGGSCGSCSIDETCKAGTCEKNKACNFDSECDDNDRCTKDKCDSVSGCINNYDYSLSGCIGERCVDSSDCSEGFWCQNGICVVFFDKVINPTCQSLCVQKSLFNLCSIENCEGTEEKRTGCYYVQEKLFGIYIPGGECKPCSGSNCLSYNGYKKTCEKNTCEFDRCIWDKASKECANELDFETAKNKKSKCGDNFCDDDETCLTCSQDCNSCPNVCGDNICSFSENCLSCSDDCRSCPLLQPNCGDDICNSNENCLSCSDDCGICPSEPPLCEDNSCVPLNEICGNQECLENEDCDSCTRDCGSCSEDSDNNGIPDYLDEDSDNDGIPDSQDDDANGNKILDSLENFCDDGKCNENENCLSCSQDCGRCSDICGDGKCNNGELCYTCPWDCGQCSLYCGDGKCNNGETSRVCAEDCGKPKIICGDGYCEAKSIFYNFKETCDNCVFDCGECSSEYCGNNVCNGNEDCGTCSQDCGECSSYCGDGICDKNKESCKDCYKDCGICAAGLTGAFNQVQLGRGFLNNWFSDSGVFEEDFFNNKNLLYAVIILLLILVAIWAIYFLRERLESSHIRHKSKSIPHKSKK